MKKIKLDLPILGAIHSYPGSKLLFKKYGLICDHCSNQRYESIEDRAKFHNVNKKKLLKDLEKLTGER